MDVLLWLLIVVVALLAAWLAVSILFAVFILRMAAQGVFENEEAGHRE